MNIWRQSLTMSETVIVAILLVSLLDIDSSGVNEKKTQQFSSSSPEVWRCQVYDFFCVRSYQQLRLWAKRIQFFLSHKFYCARFYTFRSSERFTVTSNSSSATMGLIDDSGDDDDEILQNTKKNPQLKSFSSRQRTIEKQWSEVSWLKNPLRVEINRHKIVVHDDDAR